MRICGGLAPSLENQCRRCSRGKEGGQRERERERKKKNKKKKTKKESERERDREEKKERLIELEKEGEPQAGREVSGLTLCSHACSILRERDREIERDI